MRLLDRLGESESEVKRLSDENARLRGMLKR